MTTIEDLRRDLEYMQSIVGTDRDNGNVAKNIEHTKRKLAALEDEE